MMLAGKRLNVCSGATSCCTPAMESYLVNKTHWQFHDRVLNTMRKLQQLFDNVTSTFDGMSLQHSVITNNIVKSLVSFLGSFSCILIYPLL